MKEAVPNDLATLLNGYYETPLTDAEAQDAAYNLIGLFEVLYEVKSNEHPKHT
jgi:hypothetical protein